MDKGDNPVNGKVERYLASGNRYYYLGAPVQAATAGIFGDDSELSGSNAYARHLYRYTNQWERITEAHHTFRPLEGFAFKNPFDANRYTFEGTLNTGAVSTKVGNKGWHLLGNPYPSALDWGASESPEGWSGEEHLRTSIWYREGGSGGEDGGGNYATYNRLSGATTNGGQRYIPPMQSVWVYAESTGELTVDNPARTNQLVSLYKEETGNTGLRLSFEREGYRDELMVIFNPQSGSHLEPYDTRKRFADAAYYPQIYTHAPDGTPLAVNALGPQQREVEIPVGFRTETAGEFTVTAESIDLDANGYEVYLEDRYADAMIPVEKLPYTFSAEVASGTDRFALHFSQTLTSLEDLNQAGIKVFSWRDYVQVELKQASTAQVVIYDVAGKQIHNGRMQSTMEKYHLRGPGVYVVRVNTGEKVKTQKVVIR